MNRRQFLAAFFVAPFAPLLRRLSPPKPAPVLMKPWGEELINIQTFYQLRNGVVVSRMDVVYGFGVYSPEIACRIES